MRIEILGTPFNGLGSFPDIEDPPNGLRQANLIPLLESKGHSVIDHGNLSGFQFQDTRDIETGVKNYNLWIDLSNEISQRVGMMIERGSFALLLGGDCSMLVGIISAFVQKDAEIGLVFLDGHADFHYPDTSPSGDPADMELSVITGRGPDKIVGIAGKYPLLNDEDVFVYGIRAWDHIAESSIRVYDKNLLTESGVTKAVEEGLGTFIRRNLPIWLHLDVDVFDPEFMPVMFPEPDGLTFDEVQEFLTNVTASSRVLGLSIACYHPSLDLGGSASERLGTLISNVLSN